MFFNWISCWWMYERRTKLTHLGVGITREHKLEKKNVLNFKSSLDCFVSRYWDAVAATKIFSRVFLFHFEKILGHFSLFRVFQDVSVNTDWNSRFSRHEVCALKKKKILKPKQICILYIEKPQKEKKNEKKKNEEKYLNNKL